MKIENFKGNTLIKTWSDGGEIEFKNVECSVDEGNYIKKADEEFTCITV